MFDYKQYQRNYFMPPQECLDWAKKEYVNHAPIWCSVDLRDGNQALIEPMNLEEKLDFFRLLIKLGFKEIEVGFPAASETEYQLVRKLIDQNMIPQDVTIQVLTQAREHIIRKTFEAVKGAPNVIVHVYNSTSLAQREQVFQKGREEIKQIAIEGAKLLKELAAEAEGNILFEYSPESFTGTELLYALEVCTAVQEEWQPTPEKKIIFNLPATVEMNTPNVYADQIEWMNKNFINRESVILSVHPHNDRGTGVAAAELALLAGADRVEGTLFGNGERTGNVDVLNIAYNMFSQGINPLLNLEHINEIIDVYERCTKMQIDMRHPYAGKLVFTAFSGSHQDAINKGIKAMQDRGAEHWQVPYLPIDPGDVGREYEPIVRINSQSGKGGVAFVMDTYFGFKLPKGMHKEFADIIQTIAEAQGEVSPETIMEKFREEYLTFKTEREYPYEFTSCKLQDVDDTPCGDTHITMEFKYKGKPVRVETTGNGPIDAVKNALHETTGVNMKIYDYTEHALSEGSKAKAAAYISVTDMDTGKATYGVGVSTNITRASIRAVFSGLNRLAR